MVDDAFKLTIDQIFPYHIQTFEDRQNFVIQQSKGSKFPCDGYSDFENMWDFITCLTREYRRKIHVLQQQIYGDYFM